MATLDVYSKKNEKVGAIELSDDVFFAPVRKHLLTEIVHWQRASRRSGTACVKTKAEVHGTTKKPFPQKGRGMARQGSLKNPHQIGGGVAFGPHPRDFSYAMPKAKRRAALACAVSARVQEKSFKVLDSFDLTQIKTKEVIETLNHFGSLKALIVDVGNENLRKATKNLPNAKYLEVAGLNVYDILQYPNLMMTSQAAKALEIRLLGAESIGA